MLENVRKLIGVDLYQPYGNRNRTFNAANTISHNPEPVHLQPASKLHVLILYSHLSHPSHYSKRPMQRNPVCFLFLKAKAVPLHATEALGGREGIAPTHSLPQH
jgi:hypothetical protein